MCQCLQYLFTVQSADLRIRHKRGMSVERGLPAKSTGLVQQVLADVDGIGAWAKVNRDSVHLQIRQFQNKIGTRWETKT